MSRRIRTIKPELLEDERSSRLSDRAFRLFVSGLVMSDDFGNLRANAKFLTGHAFGSTDTLPEEVAEARDELVSEGLWSLYTVRGQQYAHIKGWSKHQRIDNAGRPGVPGPNEADGSSPVSSQPPARSPSPPSSGSPRPRTAAPVAPMSAPVVKTEDTAFFSVRGEPPRVAASRRESPLDQDQEGDKDQENYYNNYSALPRMHMRTSDPLDTDSGDDLVAHPETGEPVRLVAPSLATDGADAPVAVSTPETLPPPTPRSPELPPSVAAVPPAAPTALLPPSCPETAPPAASEVRDQGATRPAPDAAVSGAPRALCPGEAYLLSLLESHPSLARIALPDVVAMSAGSIDMPGGPTRDDAAAAMADLAEVAAAAAAVGEPIRAPELARKVRSFLDNARRRRASRPASVRPAGGATSLAPASPPRRPPPPLPTGPAVPPPPAALAALARLAEKLRAPRPETFAERKARARAQVTATARAMGVL